MTHTLSKSLIYIAGLVVALGFVYMLGASAIKTEASVNVTAEYSATSTAANSVYGATVTGGRVLKSRSGTFGSVIVTGANTGVINFYDATTTNVSLRAPSMSTSTILVASLPASLAAGTYTFDVALNNGLYLDLVSGIMATTTVTYR